MKTEQHKPLIETIINTTALALTATGTNMCIQQNLYGFLLIVFGAGLEFFKYWGRKNKYW
jgi:hypothetical protein